MNQVWNVFLKDARHLWREAMAAILLLAVFSWNNAHSWANYHGLVAVSGIGAIASFQFLAGLAEVLLPVAWVLLIVRVVQSDSLVGDRQFWITRPYEWPKILTAKILFLLAFINVPLLVADLWLLARAGYSPAHYLVGLLWMQCLITLILILPALASSAVTRGIPQLLLLALLVFIYTLVLGWIGDQIPGADFASSGGLPFILELSACVAIVFLQYARRWTQKSKIVIAAVGAGVLIILVATPYRVLVDRKYPVLAANEQQPLQLSLLLTRHPKQSSPYQTPVEDWIGLPLSVSGVSPDSIVVINGAMLSIDGAGLSWSSNWIRVDRTIFPETDGTALQFSMKKAAFDRLRSVPLKAKLSIAFSLYRNMNKRDVVVPAGEFDLPDVGHCFAGLQNWRDIRCIEPLRHPHSLLMTSDVSQTTCPLHRGETPAPAGELARDWSHSDDSEPAEFGISPIKDVNFSVAIPQRAAGLCPGTPVVLSTPEPIRRGQMTIPLENLRLPEYRYAEAGLDVYDDSSAEPPATKKPQSEQKPH